MKRLFSLFVVLGVFFLHAFSVTVQLPATLDKTNYSDKSSGLGWYNTDYFDLGPGDAPNTDTWVEWSINLRYPGSYTVTEDGACSNGHQWQLQLLNAQGTVLSSHDCVRMGAYTGTYNDGTWDLSSFTAGEYRLRVVNIYEWSQPKLKSVQLEYVGELPADPDPIPDPDPSGNSVTYTYDKSIFANPERGFYYHYEKVLTANSPYAVKGNTSELTSHANEKGSLILIVYYLDNFKTTATLPSQIINAFDEDMAELRSRGMKCIVRYAYNANSSQSDASWTYVQQHIDQLKAKWQANADVIFCFQAGFVGSWGEWYYSTNFGNHATDMSNANRRSLVTKLLECVPSDRYILIRTPLFKTDYLSRTGSTTTALTASEAYQNTAKARLGHHNDAYLYGGQDQGTYSDTATQKPYIARETLYVPIGGETNETNTNNAQTKASYNNTVRESSRLHYTFINQGYAEAMTNVWRNSTPKTYDSLRVHLGYRFTLMNGTYTSQAAPGGTMSVYMKIKNVGYAPLYNQRTAYIVLKNSGHTYSIPLSTDPRTWKPNGVVSTVSEELTLPSNIATGTYQLYLHMPDAYSSLASNSAYSVRFANSNVWVASTGMNDLKASIIITNTPSTPSLTVEPTSINFGDVMQTTTATRTFSVNGANLTGGVTVSSNNPALTVSPASITQSAATAGATVTLSLTPSATGSGSATVTVSGGGATSKTVTVTWNGTAISGAVELPATLNKANHSAVSNDMVWYNTDYFDLNPTGTQFPTAYADWTVYLSYPAEYSVSETGHYENGHQYKLQLLSGNNVISEYTTTATWGQSTTEDLTFPQTAKWNLSSVPAGVYTLRVKDSLEWGEPKLKSITLECEALVTSHTVTWNATTNGGSCATATSEIDTGDPLGTLPTATKSGYVCIGWFDSSTGGHPVDEETVPAGNVTYYAQFLPIPQLSGTAVDLPNTLNKANMGAVSEDMTYYGANNDFFDLGPTDATNLYRWAAWRVNLLYPTTYTVTEETSCSNGHQYIMQLFSGNNLVAEFTTTKVSAATTGDSQAYEQATQWDLSSLSTGNYVLMVRNAYPYSQPKLKRLTLACEVPVSTYTVTWNATTNGGSCATATTTVTAGEAIGTLPSATKTGHTFVGWFTQATGGTQITAATIPTGDVTYFAQFTPDTYTISYNPGAYGTGSIASGTKTYGVNFTLSSSTFTRTGYTQTGWSTTDGGAKAYDLGGTYTANTAITLYPFWTANTNTAYIVKHWQQNLVGNDYTEVVADRQNMTGTTGANTAAAAKTYTGFTARSFSQSTIAANGSTVVNIYYDRKTYTITWKNYNNATLETDNNVRYGATPTYDGATPTRAATAQYTYTFSGWSPDVVAVTGNATYTAQFSQTTNSYTVSFNVQGHGTAPSNQTVEYGAKVTNPGNLTATGYTFGGWFKEATCTNAWNFNTDVITGAQVLYAKWTVNTHTLTWITDGDVLTGNYTKGTVAYGTTIVQPNTPTKTGYTFANWGATVPATMPDNDLTFTAQWTANTNTAYTVRHMWQNIDDNGYTLHESEAKTGTTGAQTAATAKTYTGFTAKSFSQSAIAADGNTVVDIYYDRKTYTITWKDGDNNTIETDLNVKYGATPSYNGSTPTKTATAQYTYTFNGTWSPAIAEVTGNQTYVAQFDQTVNSYTITWKNEDGTVIDHTIVEYGVVPTHADATKAADAEYTYTFAGWTPNVVAVTGAAEYTAVFSKTKNSYTITWNDENGNLIDQTTVEYGVVPTHADPTKEATAQYTYTFAGWTPKVVAVTGNASYQATFTSTVNSYTITWRNDDGSLIDQTTVEYGVVPTHADATKAATAQFTYTFSGWTPEVVAVTGNATYTAQFSQTLNSYTITWRNDDGSLIDQTTVAYGETPTHADVTKTATAEFTYTFAGWTPTIVPVTGDAEYTAVFTAKTNTYTVSFNANGHGTAPEAQTVAYGAKATQPTISAVEGYTFGGWYLEAACTTLWDFAANTVTESVELFAKWTLNSWMLTWDLAGGTITTAGTPDGLTAYGTALTAPVVELTGYEFAGWSPAVPASMPDHDATYTATWSAAGDTKYTVRHLWQNINDDEYTEHETEEKHGATGSQTAATANTYTGFTAQTIVQQTIAADGTTVVEVKYDRKTYLIAFVSEGQTLKSETLRYGAMPVAPANPTKAADAQYTYTFAGWNQEITTVTGATTYVAQWNTTVNKYKITWKNEDGSVIDYTTVAYGVVPTHADATKAADAEYTYTFAGWTPTIVPVVGDAEYTAVFSKTKNTYTITWNDENGNLIDQTTVEYGVVPTHADPTKEATAQYTYTFTGWTPEVVAVTGNATYQATFTSTVNSYTITWRNDDGSLIDQTTVAYGEVPTHADPTKAATAQYTYTFSGWTPEVVTVTGDATYTATFTSTVNEYTITWRNDDGSLIDQTTVAYGVVPTHADATKAADAEYTYTFAGWTPTIVPVTGDAEYTAVFSKTKNSYTITWKNEDGTVLGEQEVAYGETPVYSGATPTKAEDALYTYSFAGWTPEVVAVTGNATYTATFTATKKTATGLTFTSGDETMGTVTVDPQQSTYEYGQTVTVTATPNEGYEFAGWSDGSTEGAEREVIIDENTESFSAIFTPKKYLITFVNWDGVEQLQSSEEDYGTMPEYKGETPTKPEDDENWYVFDGWDPALATVTAATTYTAVFRAVPKSGGTGLESVVITESGISGPKGMRIYDYTGKDVTNAMDHLYQGTYIVVVGGKTKKVMIP